MRTLIRLVHKKNIFAVNKTWKYLPNYMYSGGEKNACQMVFATSNELPSIINSEIHPALLNKHISKQATFFTNFTIIIYGRCYIIYVSNINAV